MILVGVYDEIREGDNPNRGEKIRARSRALAGPGWALNCRRFAPSVPADSSNENGYFIRDPVSRKEAAGI